MAASSTAPGPAISAHKMLERAPALLVPQTDGGPVTRHAARRTVR
ncbi:hypothetical protein NKH18_11220 [Streptomyces sp. M10(2022)]